jgi:Asp-tRNA(Asn)/Glu-tRNA(Gln) amidotransferase A subunit family amidase
MSSYDLKSLQLPKLTGLPLRLFATALDRSATRALLLPSLLKQGGIDRLRELRLSEEPTLYPFAPAPERATGPLSPAEVEAILSLPAEPQPPPPAFPRVRDYAAAYRAGATTPLEVAERALDAIAASNAAQPSLRAIIASDRDDVLAQARAATERLQASQPLSLLDGVPVAIKDEVSQAPYPTHVGTSFLGAQPDQDCTVVARLRAAGALLLGKANMNELGLDPCGFNAHFGTTRNPYDPARDPGGSSCGPAAAVAAGLCPLAIGCDGGGSIRIPASLCGVVGLKPTFGRVSEVGAAPLCPSVDAIGPLGATVEDVALAYGLIAGPDPRDPRSQYQPPVALSGWNAPGLGGLTLGVCTPWFRHASPAVVSACETMLQQLLAAGAQLREVEVPGLDAMRIAHVVTILGEQAANMQDRREHLHELSAPTRVTLAITQAFTTVDYIQAQRVRTRAIAAFAQVFRQVDALITPTTAIAAPPIPPGGLSYGWSDLSVTTEKMRYAFPANLAGYPAISFPAGYDPDGLPIGMQAMGPYWSELLLLRIAYAAEQVLERRRPPVYYPLLG